jgi:hypothetical protein
MLARTPAALKKRRYRKRLRDGRIVLNLEVGECELIGALIRARRLTPAAHTDRAVLTREGESILADFIARFREP